MTEFGRSAAGTVTGFGTSATGTVTGSASSAAGTVPGCLLVRGAAELAAHLDIRRTVFVDEQGVFDGSDVDEHDADLATLHVLGLVDGAPGGAVRLFPLDADPAGDWQGDRLAVLPDLRSAGLGGPLVRFAVATAASRGGRRMIAHVQPSNEVFFRRLGWIRRGDPEIYVGRPHLLMDIDLRT